MKKGNLLMFPIAARAAAEATDVAKPVSLKMSMLQSLFLLWNFTMTIRDWQKQEERVKQATNLAKELWNHIPDDMKNLEEIKASYEEGTAAATSDYAVLHDARAHLQSHIDDLIGAVKEADPEFDYAKFMADRDAENAAHVAELHASGNFPSDVDVEESVTV